MTHDEAAHDEAEAVSEAGNAELSPAGAEKTVER
jgi:hypothetical protein